VSAIPTGDASKIQLGISACLLGDPVRWDGGHRHDRYLTDTLGRFVEWVPVCPEVECGMPTPREPMRLVGNPDAPRLVTSRTGLDKTEQMLTWARRRVTELEKERLCGFVFKSNSPSSGMSRVEVYDAKGAPHRNGRGMFARAFMEHFPLLPTEDEGRLHDMKLRENFIERVFTLKRWRDALARGRRRGILVDFHTTHKLLILSHSPDHCRRMGRLVDRAKEYASSELFALYGPLLMEALERKTTASKNANVLRHILGYLKSQLSADEKREALELIEEYRLGCVPLIAPITLVNHHVRRYHQPYLKQQYYLHPHPTELQLRNHA